MRPHNHRFKIRMKSVRRKALSPQILRYRNSNVYFSPWELN